MFSKGTAQEGEERDKGGDRRRPSRPVKKEELALRRENSPSKDDLWLWAAGAGRVSPSLNNYSRVQKYSERAREPRFQFFAAKIKSSSGGKKKKKDTEI